MVSAIDTERFRLRHFVGKLVALGACEVRDAPTALLDVGGVLDGNPRSAAKTVARSCGELD